MVHRIARRPSSVDQKTVVNPGEPVGSAGSLKERIPVETCPEITRGFHPDCSGYRKGEIGGFPSSPSNDL